MGAVTIQQMADRVAGLLEERLGVKGNGLSEKLRRAGGRLPSSVRAEARYLDTALVQAQNPRLLMQIDDGRVAQAYDACVKFLGAVDPGAKRRAMLMGMASSIAFSLFVVGLLMAAVLWWRGFL
jgi:hypothetical protein